MRGGPDTEEYMAMRMKLRVRRRYPRIIVDNAVLIRQLGIDSGEHFGRLSNLGAGGCGLITQESLGVGSRLGLLIAFNQGTARTSGRVVYELECPQKNDGVQVGIEFTTMSEHDRGIINMALRSPGSKLVS
jgi:hypothetical protein